MNIRYSKIDQDFDYSQDGFKKYVQNVQVSSVDKTDFDGLLSLCIDARLAVTQIYDTFKSKEPISTAGNAFFPEIKSLSNFTDNNVVVTHGIHPKSNVSNEPKCGGHIISFSEDENNIYQNLIESLKPYVKHTFTNYDPFLSTENLAEVWHASEARFYDHSTGWLYDVNDLYNKHLGVTPSIFHEGLDPVIGQDPNLIVINTLGKPYFTISRGHEAHEIGGVVEIFYPNAELTDAIIESLIFCLQAHYQSKSSQSTHSDDLENGQFENSDTLLLLANSMEDLQTIAKSMISVKNAYHKKYIEGYFIDPKDLILGMIPEIDNKLFEITAK